MAWTPIGTTTMVLLALGAEFGDPPAAWAAAMRPAASREAIERDWMLQDYLRIELPAALEQEVQEWRQAHLRTPESRCDDAVLERMSCFTSDHDSYVEERMLARVLAELDGVPGDIRAAVDRLVRAHTPGNDPQWKHWYLRACDVRRSRRLDPLVSRWTRFVFDEHAHMGESYKYTECLSDAQTDRHRHFKAGAALNVLEWEGLNGRVRPLIEAPQGILRNPDVSFDGRRVLFAWKKSNFGDDYHLYEIETNRGVIRQLTAGEGAADYEGAYLPDGNVLFSSTRCCQTVDCNWVDVSNLYLTDSAGRSLRRLGFDQVHTTFPTVTDDGRVLYTRWEYNDRAQIFPQILFQMHPDGTAQQAFYGGDSWFPTNIIHARKIPGSRQVLAIVTGHHRPAQGKLAVIDPAVGRREGRGVQLIAPVRKTDYQRIDKYALDGTQFQYPYPVTEEQFLVSAALPTPQGKTGRFNFYFMDREGRRELLVEGRQSGDGIGCRQILPLSPRPVPPIWASTVDYRKDTGTLIVQDVYQGAGLHGIARGTVKQLRVVALEYRAAAIGNIPNQKGRGGSSEVSTPVAIGNGSWDVKVVLGTAKVHPDGSAMFQVPARKPVYLQALDEKNQVVQTMRSWTTLMPGETQSCVGCHDDRNRSPNTELKIALAMQATPQPLAPFYGPARGFSFAQEIQPILDRHCVSCHTGSKQANPSLALLGLAEAKNGAEFLQAACHGDAV